MKPDFIHGPISNVFTAWHDDGRFDETGQRNFLQFLTRTGAISAYFVRSGMGQMYSFEYEDVKAITRVAMDALPKSNPVIVGSAGIWDHNLDRRPDPAHFTRQAIELSRYAESQGVAGVVHTMPEAILPVGRETEADVILRYFETVCEAVSIPTIAYQPPLTTEPYRVNVDLVQRMGDIPNLCAMKLSTDDAQYLCDVGWATRGKNFTLIAGSETGFYAALCAGAEACIGQGSTMYPQLLALLQERFEAGDMDQVIEIQRSINRLCQECTSPVQFMKRYSTEHGFPVGLEPRPVGENPYMNNPAPLTDEAYETYKTLLESELARFGF